MDRSGGIGHHLIVYQPLESQLQFHLSQARFKGYSGPVGSGKSRALCHEAIRLSYLNPGRTGLMGAPTYPMLRDATLSSLMEILEENRIPFDLNRSEFVLTFKHTGSRVLLRSMEEYERLRGTNLAWFGIDELSYTHEQAWLRLEGRLRDPKAVKLCGFAVWTPKGFDWVHRRFVTERTPGYDVIFAKAMENRYLLDAIPDYYERLKASYDDRFYRQEVLGEYVHMTAGRVYHAFDRGLHVKNVHADATRPLLWALDFNVNPMCSIVAQRHGESVIVLDEIVLQRASTEDACEEFVKRYPLLHPAGLVVYGDASGQNLRTSGASDYQIIRDFFARRRYRVDYQVPKSNPVVRERVALMNSKLLDAAGDSHLEVSPACKELIRDFEEVVYRPDSSAIDKDRDPKRTHLSDALGYLIWQECRPRSPIGEQGRRLL